MELTKFLRTLSFALLMGVNTGQLRADSTVTNKSLGSYSYTYIEKNTHYLQLDEKDSSFSLRIVDTNSDNKAGLVRLLNNGQDITFIKRDFTFEDSIKEVQLFDIANQFLEYFSNKPKELDPAQIERYNQYLRLIKERFLENRLIEKKISYNFNNFFSKRFKPQDTIEDLVMYSYVKYSGLIREAKIINPEQTFQDLLDNCNFFDKIKFLILSWNYGSNLDRLGYKLEREPLPHGDFFEIDLLNKSEAEKDLPHLKIEMNMDSIPDSVDVAEIRNFLNGKNTYLFKYDKKGNYLYGGFKCNKN